MISDPLLMMGKDEKGCHVIGCKTRIQKTSDLSEKRNLFRVPRAALKRLKWAQALQMNYDDLNKVGRVTRVCRSHFSVTEIECKDDGSESLCEGAVPLPWNVTLSSSGQNKPTQCQYIHDYIYPDTPLNKFAKEQMDYLAEVEPDLEYVEIKSRIEREWENLTEDERYYYFDTSFIQEEEWNKEHDKSHEGSSCPLVKPRSRSRKRKKPEASPKEIVKTTEVDMSLFTMEVKTDHQAELPTHKKMAPKRKRTRRRGKRLEETEQKKEPKETNLRQLKKLKRLRDKKKKKVLKQEVKQEINVEVKNEPRSSKDEPENRGGLKLELIEKL